MMRISTAFYFQTGLNSLNRQQGDLVHVFQQLGSGKRMITAADDPLAAAQTLRLGQSESANLRLEENRQVIQRNLGEEENVLMSLITQVNGAKTELLSAATGTLSDADRTIMAGVFEEMRDSMLNLGNAKDSNGQHLFSGSKGGTAPFELSADGTKYEYKGDERPRKIQADQTRQISGSDHGKDIFLRATPGSAVFTTSAADENSGTGVIGGVNITDSTQASTVESFSLKVLTGNKIKVTPTFAAGAAPNPLPDPKEIEMGEMENGKITLNLGNGVSVQLSGKPVEGDTFSLKNVQSEAGAEDLNIFNTLTDVINILKAPTDTPEAKAKLQNVLNGAMQKIDATYDNILTVRASVGARMNEVEALSDSASLQRLQIKSDISRLEDLDFYSAASQLELRRAGLEAASIAFQKIQATSLFAMNSR